MVEVTALASVTSDSIAFDDDFELIRWSGPHGTTESVGSMQWFNGALLIGTACHPPEDAEDDPPQAEIWRFRPSDRSWLRVHQGGYRLAASTVCALKNDEHPVWYGAVVMRGSVAMLRSEDGMTFTVSTAVEFADGSKEVAIDDIQISERGAATLCALGGCLYTSPVLFERRTHGSRVRLAGDPTVYETSDPIKGSWRPVSEPGFGDPNNIAINNILAFEEHLYVTTVNLRCGFQVWKAPIEGEAPYFWTKVISNGAHRGPVSAMVSDLYTFDDAMYLSSTLPWQQRDEPTLDEIGPFAAELIRLYHDGSWELICGGTRFTPDGLKRPLSGQGAGFDHPFTDAISNFADASGWLYAGTADARGLARFLGNGRLDLSEGLAERLFDQVERYTPPEYRLMASQDGVVWVTVTERGFGVDSTAHCLRENRRYSSRIVCHRRRRAAGSRYRRFASLVESKSLCRIGGDGLQGLVCDLYSS